MPTNANRLAAANLDRADHLLTAEQLDDKYNPDGDGEHPRFRRKDWRAEVEAKNTLRGYWQWVESQAEQARDEEE